MNTIFTKTTALFSLKVLIPAIIILLAAAGAYATIATAPKARKRPPTAVVQTVETQPVSRQDYHVWVPVMGTVTAARQITLEARVSGEVDTVSPTFVPGGYFDQGEDILRIDPEDYELALREVQYEVANAQYELKVEQGYQNVSAREWDLLKGSAKGTESESELALRKPHLAKAKASLAAAQAKLRQAQLNLERTRIAAPFAAMVETKDTDIGATISSQETLATLIGTDEFWVQVSVPVDRLGWIDLPLDGQTGGTEARIISGSGPHKSVREGRVVRLLPSLESEGRMARLLVSVKDPLNRKAEPGVTPLLLGSYVSVQIDGGTLAGVYAISRTAYRDSNKIWVLTDNGTLDIRTVDPIWRDGETVILDAGLATGETLVTSALSAPLQGMKLRSASTLSATTDQPAEQEQVKGRRANGETS